MSRSLPGPWLMGEYEGPLAPLGFEGSSIQGIGKKFAATGRAVSKRALGREASPLAPNHGPLAITSAAPQLTGTQ